MAGPANAVHVAPEGPRKGPPVLLVHGIGLGAWYFDRDQQTLAEQGIESWALDLPGHGPDAGRDVRMGECFDAVIAAVDAFDEPPSVFGHSAGGLCAMIAAKDRDVASIVLHASVPPSEVRHYPTRTGLKAIRPGLLALLRGKNLPLTRQSYIETGVHLLDEADQERVLSRIIPWPNGMVRDMARRRPSVPRLDCPVLVTHGFKDGAASLYTSRLLADHFDCVFWRFDDLAHLPALEPGGERHCRAVGEWILEPKARRIREIDGFSPDEGVGGQTREERQGKRVRSDSRFGDRWKR